MITEETPKQSKNRTITGLIHLFIGIASFPAVLIVLIEKSKSYGNSSVEVYVGISLMILVLSMILVGSRFLAGEFKTVSTEDHIEDQLGRTKQRLREIQCNEQPTVQENQS